MKGAWLIGIGMSFMGCVGQDGADPAGTPSSVADDAPVSSELAVAGRVGFGELAEAAPAMTTVTITGAEYKAGLAASAEERFGVIENVRPVFRPTAVAPAGFRIGQAVQR